ncbi:MAG: hypothetical protein ACEQSB_04100 [Undibacterium sp.]
MGVNSRLEYSLALAGFSSPFPSRSVVRPSTRSASMQARFSSLISKMLALLAFASALSVASAQSIPTVANVAVKGPGEAEITITGVALKPGLDYCLIGLGYGNWHGSAVKVQREKIGCAKPTGGTVTVSIRLDAKRYEKGAVISYIPIVVDGAGLIMKPWPEKPIGSVSFIRSNGQPDQAIPIRWTTDGKAVLLSAAEATDLISD